MKKEIRKTANNLTELVFILDRSGSMGGLEKDTVGGFNSMIEKQKTEKGDALVSTVLFDHESEVVHDRVPLSEISPLTEKEYFVRGSTALIDALGGAVKHISNVHKYIRSEDVPSKTVFVITTDGMENSSHRYSSEEVKKMIEKKKKDEGWEFLFIGANIDAVETAKNYGIAPERAVNYKADSRGTGVLYKVVGKAIGAVRANRTLEEDWGEELEDDMNNRK